MRGCKPPHLFACWETVRRNVKRHKHLALLLDFDGTLVPIRGRVGSVRLERETQRLLERLARRPRLTVSLVSGRRRADLRQRAGVSGARYLGLHGWEANHGTRLPKEAHRILRNLKRRLALRLRDLPGVELEDKGWALSVHYRGAVRRTAARARAALRETLRAFDGRLRVVRGKKIWEVLPRENRGKGAAILSLARAWPASTLAIYLGDDASDEGAFRALPRSLTVLVGRRRRTAARYRLRGPSEVREFLERLESEVR